MEELYCAILELDLHSNTAQMDDLLKAITKLSANIKYSKSEDSVSSKEETVNTANSAKKLPRKKRKTRNKKHRGRKRQLNYIPEEAGSSSYTDCNDEEILRDYIENITGNLECSDSDFTLSKGAFLVKREFLSPLGFPNQIHPEVDETDSFSESFLLTHSRKKRRKFSKKHHMEIIESKVNESGGPSFSQDGRNQLDQVVKQQHTKKSSNPKCSSTNSHKKIKLDRPDDDDVEMEDQNATDHNSSQDSSQANTSSDSSDTSTNSHSPGSEADDEGEESCVEGGSAIKPIIPWWDHSHENKCSISQQDLLLEQSLSLIRGRTDIPTRQAKPTGPMKVLLESGGFVAYANHKIKKFVMNRDFNELSLYTTSRKERSQIMQLAALYELQCSVEEVNKSNKVVLAKTSFTKDADQQALKMFLSRELKLRWRKNRPMQKLSKRRKVNPPAIMEDASFQSNHLDIPVPDANIGHQMLRAMGWKPGQGLGKESSGMINPIKAVKRPRNLGFGHPDP